MARLQRKLYSWKNRGISPHCGGSRINGLRGSTALFDHYASQLPTKPLDIKEFAVETVLSADGILPNSPFQFGIQITPTGSEPLVFEQTKDTWPLFTPITGDFWMINETKITKTENGGIRILFDSESLKPNNIQRRIVSVVYFRSKLVINGSAQRSKPCFLWSLQKPKSPHFNLRF